MHWPSLNHSNFKAPILKFWMLNLGCENLDCVECIIQHKTINVEQLMEDAIIRLNYSFCISCNKITLFIHYLDVDAWWNKRVQGEEIEQSLERQTNFRITETFWGYETRRFRRRKSHTSNEARHAER